LNWNLTCHTSCRVEFFFTVPVMRRIEVLSHARVGSGVWARAAGQPCKSTNGILIAAPGSGSGKTTVTLGLLRQLRERGMRVRSLKVGPDYIDPAFHTAASGCACRNLDPWAMRVSTFSSAISAAARDAEVVVVEGVMGLFDGATVDEGSTADVAAATGWPVVLVVDAGAMGASAAAVVHGFSTFRDDVDVAGVIFNRVGSDRHAELLVEATAGIGVPVLGCLRRDAALALPDRHLGLVQASEHPDLDSFLEAAATAIGRAVDIDGLLRLARRGSVGDSAEHAGAGRSGVGEGAHWRRTAETDRRRDRGPDNPRHRRGAIDTDGAAPPLPVLGQRIAVACDEAFAFSYPHVLDGWRQAGVEVATFSPLGDEAPSADADAVYLPGGYPELHAGRIAAAGRFMEGLRAAAGRGAVVYGECGGYMVLGEALVDADGEAHAMAGLLPLETTFAERGLTLGYRSAWNLSDGPLGREGAGFRGHEFHYARVVREGGDEALFRCADARGRDLGPVGRRVGRIMGSFVHLIDRTDEDDASART